MASDHRSQFSLMLGFSLLVALILGSVWTDNQQKQSFALVRHTLEVEGQLSAVMSDFQDAENGQRGFLITGQPDFLATYESAIRRVDGDLKALENATLDNPSQQARFKRMRDLSTARLVLLGQVIAVYRSGDRTDTTAREQLAPGKALMDQIRGVVAAMKAEERGLLQSMERDVVRKNNLAQAGLILR